ncbi:helix-turn-helix domain-containing protein [Haliea sp. E1-2-M8]|uniref:helix-turn-helix domain-containing protein n=1 Tax=Haliea sp. E1-2-M8 TaxID=3064706 RepID=UPI0027252B0D|nr:helix-turn-helix domain-containing protein [Haliea sp. E1-2-M8]MDO8864193.1 helix-turn-helix domain-containing protein [Haliea sp. E1-2-M8]
MDKLRQKCLIYNHYIDLLHCTWFYAEMNAKHRKISPAQRLEAKWKGAVGEGFTGYQLLPDILIRSQASLGINDGEMVVLLNVLMHWWVADVWPFPRAERIAARMGVSKRTVDRHLMSLEQKGLIERLAVETFEDRPAIRRISLEGLVDRLQELAEEMRRYEDDYAAEKI